MVTATWESSSANAGSHALHSFPARPPSSMQALLHIGGWRAHAGSGAQRRAGERMGVSSSEERQTGWKLGRGMVGGYTLSVHGLAGASLGGGGSWHARVSTLLCPSRCAPASRADMAHDACKAAAGWGPAPHFTSKASPPSGNQSIETEHSLSSTPQVLLEKAAARGTGVWCKGLHQGLRRAG